MNQKIVTQNALTKSAEKKVGEQRPYIDQINWQMLDEINKQKKSKGS